MTQVLACDRTTEDESEQMAEIWPLDRSQPEVAAPSLRLVHGTIAPPAPVTVTNHVEAETSTAMSTGLLGFPPPVFDPAARVTADVEPGLLHELKILALVLVTAMAAGALVATIGIVLTV